MKQTITASCQHLEQTQKIINDLLEANYTGGLTIQFNKGKICSPVTKQYKKDLHNAEDCIGFGKVTVTVSNYTKKNITDICEQIWFTKSE